MTTNLMDLIETDRYLDALGESALYEWERMLMKPRKIRYGASEVTAYDALGEVIPELSGPYTDELKAKLDELDVADIEHIDR